MAILLLAGHGLLLKNGPGHCVVGGPQGQMVAAAAMEGLQRVLKHQFPLSDNGHMVSHLVDLTQKVAGYHHCHTEPLRQGADQLPHLLNARRVQTIGWFVQDQQFGIA